MVLCECVGQVWPRHIRVNSLVIERVEQFVLLAVRIVLLVGELGWAVCLQLHLLDLQWLGAESLGQVCCHSIKSLRIMFENSFIQFFIMTQLLLLIVMEVLLYFVFLLCLRLDYGYSRRYRLFIFTLPVLQVRYRRLARLLAHRAQQALAHGELLGVGVVGEVGRVSGAELTTLNTCCEVLLIHAVILGIRFL